MSFGVLEARGATMVMVARYIPALNPVVRAWTVNAFGSPVLFPVSGVTESHEALTHA